MSNLKDQLRNDLDYIKRDWWIPISLIAPDKTIYDGLLGDVRKESKEYDPDTGEMVTVKKLSITIKIDDLIRVPKENETWFIDYPDTLLDSGTPVRVAFNSDNVFEGGDSHGYIKIYPQEIEL